MQSSLVVAEGEIVSQQFGVTDLYLSHKVAAEHTLHTAVVA
jgi:hypothetical protein